MRLRILFAAVVALSVSVTQADGVPHPASPPVDRAYAHDLLSDLIGIDTTHAAGSARAVALLEKRFRAAGFGDAEIWIGGPRPDKLNIVVRLKGRTAAPAVLFNAHLDVVEAVQQTWSVEPFKLTEKDGWYYGRGAIDVKNEVSIITTNLIRIKREGVIPERDVIAFFNTDEEAGGDANGVEWMVNEHRNIIDAGLVINDDAGKMLSLNGRPLWNTIQTSEKAYATYEVSATGLGGHSSLPRPDNAIARLSRALVRLDDYQFPVRIGETSRRYLLAMRERASPTEAQAIDRILSNPNDSSALTVLRANPVLNAQLHSTCPMTLISGGQSESALPIRAVATLQCRLLPDEKPEEVLATLAHVVDDGSITIKSTWGPLASPAQPLDGRLMQVIERLTREFWDGALVVPFMSQGASDNVYFRRAGFNTFGVSGTVFDEADMRQHGSDERIGVSAFYDSLEFNYQLMRALSGGG